MVNMQKVKRLARFFTRSRHGKRDGLIAKFRRMSKRWVVYSPKIKTPRVAAVVAKTAPFARGENDE